MNIQEIDNIISRLNSLKENLNSLDENLTQNITTESITNIKNYINSKQLFIGGIKTKLETLKQATNELIINNLNNKL